MKFPSRHDPGRIREGSGFPLASIFLLTAMFYLNFLPRLIMAPLMVTVENELHLGHDDAGVFFLLISAGYCITFLASGFISSRLAHHKTILLSTFAVGVMLLLLSKTRSVFLFKVELFFLGAAAAPYFPSGLASVMAATDAGQQGKGIAVHELAPSLSYISAPLIAELFLGFATWRFLLSCLGFMTIAMGVFYFRFGKDRDIRGRPLSFRTAGLLLRDHSFRIICFLFVLGMGAGIGLYTMMPLFLVHEHLFDRGLANSLVSLSRFPGIAAVLIAGFALDRFGIKRSLMVVLITSGVLIFATGIASKQAVAGFLLVQYAVAVGFFPAAWMAVSRIDHPEAKSAALALAVPIAYVFGAGVLPATIGFLGEHASFSWGFIGFGALTVIGGLVSQKIKLSYR